MGTPSTGVEATIAVDDSDTATIGDFDSNSFSYEVNSENLRMVQNHVNSAGIRGSRSRVKERVRIAQEQITGSIVMNPTPIELDEWLPRILGAAESTDTFALAETVPAFSVLIDRVANRFIYKGCYVNRATFRGSQGGLIEMSLDLEGKTETVSGTAVPGTVPAIDNGAPYVFSDLTFSLGVDASAAEVRDFEIVIDNVLDTQRYMNSVTRSQLPSTDRIITCRMTVPYTADEADLYDQAVAGGTGSLTLTNGGVSTVFTFGNLKAPTESPVIQSKGEILLSLNMTAYKSDSTDELVVTHDSAP